MLSPQASATRGIRLHITNFSGAARIIPSCPRAENKLVLCDRSCLPERQSISSPGRRFHSKCSLTTASIGSVVWKKPYFGMTERVGPSALCFDPFPFLSYDFRSRAFARKLRHIGAFQQLRSNWSEWQCRESDAANSAAGQPCRTNAEINPLLIRSHLSQSLGHIRCGTIGSRIRPWPSLASGPAQRNVEGLTSLIGFLQTRRNEEGAKTGGRNLKKCQSIRFVRLARWDGSTRRHCCHGALEKRHSDWLTPFGSNHPCFHCTPTR